MKKITKAKLSVMGLGKLGACYAAFYASKGYQIIGFDVKEEHVQAVNEGRAPVQEPELAELIAANRKRISAASDPEKLIGMSDVTFIVVPTPSKKDGSFSTAYVVDVAKKIGPALRTKKGYHLLVLVSTVLPEDSRNAIIPALEKYSGKKCGVDFGYCYSPSLIAIGDIIGNLRNPDFLFLGAYDKKSGNMLEEIYQDIYGGAAPIERMSVESAELAKISLNSYVTMKITFANILGEICSRLPHANVDDITGALGKDKRIGQRYFRSGLGYGGPCFPRDNFAFANMAMRRGIKTPLALATHTLNELIPAKVSRFIASVSQRKKHRIGILGISYKPKTTHFEESQALKITQQLLKKNYRVTLFEHMGHDHAKEILHNTVTYAASFQDLLDKSHVMLVSNPDPLFARLPHAFNKSTAKKTIIDPWGMFRQDQFPKHVTYISLGRTPLKNDPRLT
ncbi:MAG: UDP-glucose/GDP-mannose dehydrogenase family protein [Candidatus Sungbacteria bacterium]|nr:UDP-glucose/GDP-mannose dehydrogenase family protein [Candidatus Sungbacteria bacterium]